MPHPPSRAKLGRSSVRNLQSLQTRNPQTGARLSVHRRRHILAGESPPASAGQLSRAGSRPACLQRPSIRLILSQGRATFSFPSNSPAFSGCCEDGDACAFPQPTFGHFPDRHSGCGRVQLFLLFGHSENQCRHRDHRAIHSADLGVALHGCARPAETNAQRVGAVGLAVAGIALVIGLVRWRGIAPGPRGFVCRSAGCFLFCLLQHWRPRRAGSARSLDSAALHHWQRVPVMAGRESAVEGVISALLA